MHTKNKKFFSAFTLVELIIVITILAVLATIAFVSFRSYTASSRDANRVMTLKNIETGLNMLQVQSATYPIPDGEITSGFVDGVEVAKKGIIGKNITSLLKISKIPTDPMTSQSYSYGISQDQKSFQLATILETPIAQNTLIQPSFANNYIAKVVGNYKGYLEFQTGSQTYVANVPSLIFNLTNGNTNLLSGDDVFFIVDKKKNFPNQVADAIPNNIPGNTLIKELYGTNATLIKLNISAIKSAPTQEEKIGLILDFGANISGFGVNSAEDFLAKVIEKQPVSTSQGEPIVCPENPTSSEYFTFSGGTISAYSDSGPKDVVIPCRINGEYVKIIGNSAFQNKGLTSVIIPNTVTTLQQRAFYINSLTQVVIPNSVTNMTAAGIFLNNQLTSVTLSSSAPIIGQNAFGNNKLTTLTIPQGVTTLSNGAFNNNLLTSVTLPNSITSIVNNSFTNNTSLTSVTNYDGFSSPYIYIPVEDGVKIVGILGSISQNFTIPETLNGKPVRAIGNNVFSNKQLTSVTIPNSVTSIGDVAFYSNQLSSVTIPNSVTSIGGSAFASNQLSSVTIPNSVTSIGMSAFASNQLSSVTIPNSVTSIGSTAFASNKLSSVTIPNSVTSIGDTAFAYNQLSSVTIPNSVTSIGSNVFNGNPSLGSITNYDNFSSNWLYIPVENGIKLVGYYGPAISDQIIPETINGKNVLSLGTSLSTGMGNLNSLTIPNSVTFIGEHAFSYRNIVTLNIGSNVQSIGQYAFDGNRITNITFPESLTSIGNNAFAQNALTSITFNTNISSIGNNAFTNQMYSASNGGFVYYKTQTQRNTYHNATYIDLAKLPNDVIQP